MRRRTLCEETGCHRRADYRCSYRLRGARRGAVCARGICEAHAHAPTDPEAASDRLCPVHGKIDVEEDEAFYRDHVQPLAGICWRFGYEEGAVDWDGLPPRIQQLMEGYPVKAIAISQPRATLLALGLAQYIPGRKEADYRGRTAIYATDELDEELAKAFHAKGLIPAPGDLPLQRVIGEVQVVAAEPATVNPDSVIVGATRISEHARACGGWANGQLALRCMFANAYPEPIKLKASPPEDGALWDWDKPEGDPVKKPKKAKRPKKGKEPDRG